MKSIELTMKVGEMYPGCILIVSKNQYYNPDGSFTIIRGGEKLILKKSLFKPYRFRLN
jgi:hypothetical protein